MHCLILAIGQKMPLWCTQACQEYIKRLQHVMPTQCIELATSLRSKTGNADLYKEEEGQKILQKISPQDHVIALEVNGKTLSTQALSQAMANWRQQVKRVVFLIGGPDGLSRDCLNRANQQWSLSALTFPHALARVILLEQLYRAASIIEGHPYHRE